MNGLMVTIALAASTRAAEQNAPHWIKSYASALDVARASRRPLLVVFHGPEDAFQQVEFQSEGADPNAAKTKAAVAVNSVLLSKYTLCKIDVSTAYGRRVAGAFQVHSFPYTAITDQSAKRIVYRREGKFSDEAWVNTLVAYQHDETETSAARPHRAAATRNSISPISTFSFPTISSSPDSSPAVCRT